MVEWGSGFFIPIIELVIVGGIICFFAFIIGKAIYTTWRRTTKWFFKYKIFRNKYDPAVVEWVGNAILNDVPYFEAKRLLLIHGTEQVKVSEILYIYIQILKEIEKGGSKEENGRRFESSNRKIKSTEIGYFPKI